MQALSSIQLLSTVTSPEYPCLSSWTRRPIPPTTLQVSHPLHHCSWVQAKFCQLEAPRISGEGLPIFKSTQSAPKACCKALTPKPWKEKAGNFLAPKPNHRPSFPPQGLESSFAKSCCLISPPPQTQT